MSKSKQAHLRRLIKKADSLSCFGLCHALLFTAMLCLIYQAFAGETLWASAVMYGCVIAFLAILLIIAKKRRRIAFVNTVEYSVLLLVLTALLPIKILLDGIRSIPRYYYVGIECLAALQKFR